MKKVSLLCLALTLVIVGGCSVSELNTLDPAVDGVSEIDVLVNEYIEDNSVKSSLSTSGVFAWDVDDQLGLWPDQSGVFSGDPEGIRFRVKECSGSSAVFEGNGWSLTREKKYYAFAPFISSSSGPLTIPYNGQIQVANDNSSHTAAFNYMHSSVTVPQTGNASFTFRNIGTYNRFTVTVPGAYSTVEFTSFSLTTTDAIFAEQISFDPAQDEENFTVPTPVKTISMVLEGENGFTATDGSLVLYMMMAPTAWGEKEVTVSLISTTGDIYTGTFTPSKDQVGGKSYGYKISTIEKTGKVHPDNEIWYTTVSGSSIVSSCTDYFNQFGANLVSNTYEEGKGILKFDNPVTHVGGSYFYANTDLSNIILPSSINSIQYFAFAWCLKLEKIDIPEGVTSISARAFYHCPRLGQFTGKFASSDGRCLIDGNTLIAFAPYGLTSYIVQDGITRIAEGTFGLVGGISEITLPESLQTIEYGCFDNSSITSMHIPSNVNFIGSGAFESCNQLSSFTGRYASEDHRLLIDNGEAIAFAPSGLTKYTFPDNVTSIAPSLVYCIYTITEITVPASVKSIGSMAFGWCQHLKTVRFLNNTPPSFGTNIFVQFMPNVIYVPYQSINAYKSAENFSSYSDLIKGNAIDLGLSVKWATSNIGTYSPEGIGNYYSWGEVSTKSSYTWGNYKWMTNGESSWSYITKYQSPADFAYHAIWYKNNVFIGDGIMTLLSSDDVATQILGSDWRLPTLNEISELLDENNCTWTWTNHNGVNGYLITSKVSGYEGNSIFLPVGGYYDETSISDSASGYYWSSDLRASFTGAAHSLKLTPSDKSICDSDRYKGLLVRPVYTK